MLIKLEWLGYRMVKKLWQYVKPFSSNTRTSRTDVQTDGQTNRQTYIIAISISRVSVLTRDKNGIVSKDRQVHYTYVAAGASNDRGRTLQQLGLLIFWLWYALFALWPVVRCPNLFHIRCPGENSNKIQTYRCIIFDNQQNSAKVLIPGVRLPRSCILHRNK